MRRLTTEIVVVGGGATGCGIVRDCAMRGFKTVLLERGDIAQGTSGRFHGAVHSGGRYVVSDPGSAAECVQENSIITRVHADAVETTGGFFISVEGDDPEFPDRFVAGAKIAGMPCQEISLAQALRLEPRINPRTERIMSVQDATVDVWKLCWGAVRSAQAYGAEVLTYTVLSGVEVVDGRVRAVRCQDRRSGEAIAIDCDFLINAAGPWAGQVARLAGVEDVDVVPGRGVMVAMGHRLVNRMVNHLVKPADGDIVIPVHTTCVIGTTDTKVDQPDDLAIPRVEVQKMLDCAELLVPGFRQARSMHAWAGARPLIKDTRVSESDTRHMSRGMSVMDHETRDGVAGLMTIGGGKLTTYRLMARNVVDAVCRKLGQERECRTDQEAVPGSESGRTHRLTDRLQAGQRRQGEDLTLCECEQVSRQALVDLLERTPQASLDDLRRQTRLGMGLCQGGFCSWRAAGAACQSGAMSPERAVAALKRFLSNRWIGLWPVLYGDQLKQTALNQWILAGTLDLDHLPESSQKVL
ncbi:MAG: anaerobic glycerol-3-phosphate dehydrogenase subunit A [Propionibacteriaceae bacterium]|nr:anaerobic glycerol-3-phosphate dehydrogenase subunit A [Propionibacteriaceae bacterium]